VHGAPVRFTSRRAVGYGGYTGGQKKNPTYKEVSAGGTGHAEAVQIVYDPSKIRYETLLDVYWHNIDPTVKDRQFCDTGNQYRAEIFYHTEEQRRAASLSKEAVEKTKTFKEPVVTGIVAAGEFYPAEEYHQHYYKKNPIRYNYYRTGCGRDRRLKELWGSAAGERSSGETAGRPCLATLPAATARRLRTGKPPVQDRGGAPHARGHRDRPRRAIHRARSALHAGVAVEDPGPPLRNSEDGVRTHLLAHPAPDAGGTFESHGGDTVHIPESVHQNPLGGYQRRNGPPTQRRPASTVRPA